MEENPDVKTTNLSLDKKWNTLVKVKLNSVTLPMQIDTGNEVTFNFGE